MRNSRLWIAFGFWLCAGAIMASAGTRKAGLWETTTTTTWQEAPSIPKSEGKPLVGGTHTTQVCLTQEMIDKYGALLPQSRGECSLENKVITPGNVTADYICSGRMSGKGALESTWTDAEHVKGKIHFIGTIQVGSEAQPVEWTTESISVFKSSDCSAIQPSKLPSAAH